MPYLALLGSARARSRSAADRRVTAKIKPPAKAHLPGPSSLPSPAYPPTREITKVCDPLHLPKVSLACSFYLSSRSHALSLSLSLSLLGLFFKLSACKVIAALFSLIFFAPKTCMCLCFKSSS